MKNDAKRVTPLPGFRLEVELVDGRVGVFDMQTHLNHPGLAALRDQDYFQRVSVLYGALTWPHGEDVAPDTVAAELTSHAAA